MTGGAPYTLLADLVVVLHLGWIGFLVLGAVPGRRWRWVRWLHLGGLAFAGLLTWQGWVCPLTHLEVWLRRRGGGAGYPGSFIGHYAERLVYADVPRGWVLGALVLVVAGSAWAYWPRGGAARGSRRRSS